jgi:excisionase family DNA binding protein
MGDAPQLMTVAQAGARLQCSPQTVTNLIDKGRLPALNVATGPRHRDFRIDPADLDKLRFAPQPPRSANKPHRRRRRSNFRPLLRIG